MTRAPVRRSRQAGHLGGGRGRRRPREGPGALLRNQQPGRETSGRALPSVGPRDVPTLGRPDPEGGGVIGFAGPRRPENKR